MTAKEYLSQYQDIEIQIEADRLEAVCIRSIAQRITANISEVRVMGGEKLSRVEMSAIRLVEIEEQILLNTKRLVETREEIEQSINALENFQEKTILKLRYLAGEKWEKIADIVNYSNRQVHNIHSRALKKIRISEKGNN